MEAVEAGARNDGRGPSVFRVTKWVFMKCPSFCAAVIVFRVAPIVEIVPLCFKTASCSSFTEGMLRPGLVANSLRWQQSVQGNAR